MTLAGCAAPQEQLAPRGELLTPGPAITDAPAAGVGKTSGMIAGDRLRLERPVAVAARRDVLVIADAGTRALWRYDRTRGTMQSLAPFTLGAEEQASIQIDPEMRTWLALPAEQALEHLDAQGKLLKRWHNDAQMSSPVAVLWREDPGELLVADGATLQILSLDRGGVARRVPMPDTAPLKSIAGLAQGPDRLYVLDHLGQQVIAVGPKGELRETIGRGYLVMPRAVAADRAGRVFVADEVDQRIYVFRGEKLIGRARGTFGRIESMALEGSVLYVADSLLGRVHVLQVVQGS
jgi:sugar lactone lactonase YvrE